MSTTHSISPPLVLASGSPRRRQLLQEAGIQIEVIPANTAEIKRAGESARQEIERLATEKAQAVARKLGPQPARLVLGSDTGVVLDDEVLGKPRDSENAVELLQRLMNRTHTVITAVALAHSDTLSCTTFSVDTEVTFGEASLEAIQNYVATGEPMDKAGAYAIQGEGKRFITKTSGSESNVIGLPMERTLTELRKLGISAVEAAS
jgi:septum formation protein